MEKKEVNEENSKMKRIMKRAEKAYGQIEMISRLMSVQLFLSFLRIHTIHTSLEPTPLQADEDMSTSAYLRYLILDQIWYNLVMAFIIFPWVFKSIAKEIFLAPSAPSFITLNMYSILIVLTLYFEYMMITKDFHNPDLDQAASKTFIELLLACNKNIAIAVLICFVISLYHMFHLFVLEQRGKNSKKDQPDEPMEQKVSNPEKTTKISMENEKLGVEKMEV